MKFYPACMNTAIEKDLFIVRFPWDSVLVSLERETMASYVAFSCLSSGANCVVWIRVVISYVNNYDTNMCWVELVWAPWGGGLP